MAIKKNIQIKGVAQITAHGMNYTKADFSETINDVYIRVNIIRGGKDTMDTVVGYYNGDKFLGNQTFTFRPSLDGDNFIKQAYLHLKTLPEFSNAVDC